MSTSNVPWESRVKYINATNKLVKALTRSLDEAQVGQPLADEIRVLRIEHRAVHNAYNEAVAAARG